MATHYKLTKHGKAELQKHEGEPTIRTRMLSVLAKTPMTSADCAAATLSSSSRATQAEKKSRLQNTRFEMSKAKKNGEIAPVPKK
jgi:hypothetical protein